MKAVIIFLIIVALVVLNSFMGYVSDQGGFFLGAIAIITMTIILNAKKENKNEKDKTID